MKELWLFLGIFGLLISSVWAETTEIVTYYPTSGSNEHATSLTVGNDYLNTVLADGQALIQTSLGIGTGFGGGAGNLLEVRGVSGVTSNALFLAGTGIGSNIRVGIGVAVPNEQLEISGNFRLPPTTAATGIIFSGANRFIHNFGTNNFFAGVNAGNFTLTGTGNVGIGPQTLLSLTSGVRNIAIGTDALLSNRSGSGNVAIGTGTISFSTLGSDNVAIGRAALANVSTVGALSGQNNVAMGSTALVFNTTGSENVALGFQSGVTVTQANANTTGSNNTFVGFNAGPGTATQLNNATALGANALVSASNALVLGGTGANAVNVGIGTETPAQRLHVVGTVRIVDGTQANGRVLTSDANGVASWQASGAAGFPAPDYDSGWVTSQSPGNTKTYTHNLGTLEYMVYIEGRTVSGDHPPGTIHQVNNPGGTDASWLDSKKTNSVVVMRHTGDTDWDETRVRCWRW